MGIENDVSSHMLDPSHSGARSGRRAAAPDKTRQSRPARPAPARLHQFFEASCGRDPGATAVVTESSVLTYSDLDERSNQMAQTLAAAGIGPGDRVGILLERSVLTYVCLLGVSKSGAAFVPIDPASPPSRVGYITSDANIDVLLSTRDVLAEREVAGCPVWALNEIGQMIAGQPTSRVQLDDTSDAPAYIIYTSGSSGQPKGVEVAHSSICNFISVVPRLYNVSESDRVYQGMTIAFDFSIEEIWPTWAVGATVVAGPTDGRRLGAELGDFLEQQRITVMYCVPTVLATIDRDLPGIHTLNVGGEACPQELVERWATQDRLILNTYGPTEATVTCIYTELVAGRPVVIGHPLPTYEAYLLDQDLNPVADGEVGEICVGGPGVALGYVGRPELTASKFIPHPFGGQGRIYRTGDLGRMTGWGIEYRGRADDEVKVRGHRVDLGEIEAQFRLDPRVSDAVVALTPTKDLAAFITLAGQEDPALTGDLRTALGDVLPGYMIPTFCSVVESMPMLPSGKVDRKSLPEPTQRFAGDTGPVQAAGTALERDILGMWARALGLPAEEVSVEADFFVELPGHSLAAATAVSRAREAYPGIGLGVGDLYANPTVRAFAAHVQSRRGAAQAPSAERLPIQRHSGRRVAIAGAAQLLAVYVLYFVLGLPVGVVYTDFDGRVSTDMMWSLLTWIPIVYLVVRWLVPIVGIRMLSWRLRPGEYGLWGAVHLRTWAIQRLLELSPLTMFAGSPWAAAYLRWLGSDVQSPSHIGTASVSLPSMVRIGAGASVGYGAHLQPISVVGGRMLLDRIDIGADAFVGASAHLSGGSSLADDAVLAEHSVLSPGQRVSSGQILGGSPAVPVSAVSPMLAEIQARSTPARQSMTLGLRSLLAAGALTLEALPFLAIAPAVALVWWALLTYGLLAGFVAAVAAGPVYVITVCLVLAMARAVVVDETPRGVHPAISRLGLQRWYVDKVFELSLILTNSLYATLYTPHWLRLLGAKIGRNSEVSTLAHVDPELLVVADEGFVADMAHVGSAVVHNGYLAMATTTVGYRSFVGNASFIPAGNSLGDGSLVGVHTVPPAGSVPADTSWLGSPAIHLPRRQESKSFTDDLIFNPPRSRVIERLIIEFFRITAPAALLGVMVFLSLQAISEISRGQPYWVVLPLAPLVLLAGSFGVVLVVAAFKWVLIGDYAERVEPLWGRFVRWSELVTGMYEAAAVPAMLNVMRGTPMLPSLLKLFGARIGDRAYLDTTYLTEFDLVEIGSDAAVGSEVSLQTHLFEDRVMKMSTVKLKDASSIGERSVVLYDASVGERADLGPLSLVMKGEDLPADTRWLGIPAAQHV